MSAMIAGVLAVLTSCAILISAGMFIADMRARLKNVEGDVTEQGEALSNLTESINSLDRTLRDFNASGSRYSLEDANNQYNQSYQNFVQDPDGFWLAKPSHQRNN